MLKSELLERIQRSLEMHGDGPVKLAVTFGWCPSDDLLLEDLVESPESGALHLVFQDDVPFLPADDESELFESGLDLIKKWPSGGQPANQLMLLAGAVAAHLNVPLEELRYHKTTRGSDDAISAKLKHLLDVDTMQLLSGLTFESHGTLEFTYQGHPVLLAEEAGMEYLWCSQEISFLLEQQLLKETKDG